MFELIIKLSNDFTFRNIRNYEIRKNSKLGGDVEELSLPSRNKNLTTLVKNNAKTYVKVFWFFPVLLDFCVLFQIFCPTL